MSTENKTTLIFEGKRWLAFTIETEKNNYLGTIASPYSTEDNVP